MQTLSEKEKQELITLIEAGKAIPSQLLQKISLESLRNNEIGKEYRLVYDGKMRREEILANTPAAPWQLVRRFSSDKPHADKKWHNLLVWGDNLIALRELLADQQGPDKYGTRNKIKLIYIDPPFATKQDFMKDKEKVYHDKVIGSQFIEFIRKRLILLNEILAQDGSIYVHMDQKKGHYIKAIMDEVFGEQFFINEIIWKRRSGILAQSKQYGVNTDSLFFYSKSANFNFDPPTIKAGAEEYVTVRFKYFDEKGRRYRLSPLVSPSYSKNLVYDYKGYKPPQNGWACSLKTMQRWDSEGKLVFPKKKEGRIQRKQYLDEWEGRPSQTLWEDIPPINPQADERLNYPTQKPEKLIERILNASSKEGDIVLDAFVGSGTTVAVAEKLGRRWIAMDCGKLAIYAIQKRLFSLTSVIGSGKKDNRSEIERTGDWEEHIKNNPSILLISEKARRGECEVTIDLLDDLSELVHKHSLLKKDTAFSLVCPEEKMLIPKKLLKDVDEGAGAWAIKVKGIEFRISVIEKKEKQEPEKVLKPREFALYRAGIYDMSAVKQMAWDEYRPFVLKLFGVREHEHKRYGTRLDGYIGTDSTLVWNYPDFKKLTLDHGYVDDLHSMLRGKPGERFYIIAPVVSMAFAEDEITRNDATYVFLKVPLSILMRLIEKHEPAALKQPSKEEDVNEVIDAVGFDFISQPVVTVKPKMEKQKGGLFNEYVLEVEEFRSQTLATDPDDFANFETFSMAMADLDYDGKIFRLNKVFWGDDLIKEAEGLENAKKLILRIPEESFKGEQMMVIFCDRYGNEKSLVYKQSDFGVKSKAKVKKSLKRRSKK